MTVDSSRRTARRAVPRRRLPGLLGAAFLLAVASCDTDSPTPPPDPEVAGSVAGSVQVEGTGIAGVQVSISGPTTRSQATDAGGRFRFDGLAEGTWVVSVTGLPDAADFSTSAGSASITRSAPTATVEFVGTWKRDAAIVVTVRVAGQGFEAATVNLDGPGGPSTAASAATDASGSVRFDGLRRGAWQVTLGGYDATLFDFPTPTVSVEAGGSGPVAVAFDGTEIPQPPAAPTGLIAAATGADAIGLTWTDASDDEERFDIERRSPGGAWSLLASVADGVTTEADAGLHPATTWAYRVRACSAAGCSTPSNEAEATTDDVPPTPPTGLSATSTGPSGVLLTWTDASHNETRFEVERRESATSLAETAPAGPWTAVAVPGADETSLDDEGLTPAATYEYRIRACNEVGCSAFSGVASVTTDDVPPTAPVDPAVVVTGATSLRATWTDASHNEDTFEVERREGASGSWTAVGAAAADETRWADSGLLPTTTYGYRVRACNGVGCSAWTAEATGTTADVPPLAPTSLAAAEDGESEIDLSWVDESTNETGFEIQRSANGSSWSALTSLPAGSTAHTDSGLAAGTTRYYRVRACNTAGCSSWSNDADATTDSAPAGGPNLSIGGVYINQRIQRLAGDVPLVADMDGYLRVFVLADEANSLTPDVRVDFHLGGGLVHTETLAAPGASVPESVDESSLSSSWNVLVPGSLIQPDLEIEVVVDPADAVAESDESDNAWPGGGGLELLDVRDTPTFEVTFVPVRQTVNGTVGDVDAGNAGNFLDEALEMLPFADADVEIRAEYSTDLAAVASGTSSTWSAVLSEVSTLRSLDGSSRYYYGVLEVTYGGGIAGIGYVGWPVALGWDKSGSAGGVAAHEWGHNLGRPHSPGCGAGGADSSYPHAGGRIGHWGLDVSTLGLKSPDTHHDFMTYCGPEWISDYVFEKIIDRVAPPTYVGIAGRGTGRLGANGRARPGLLVWGRIEGDEVVLEPALDVVAPASVPTGGAYTLSGREADGSTLFSYAFDPIAVADGDGDEAHFNFVIPVDSFDRASLAELRLSSTLLPVATVREASGDQALAPGVTRAVVGSVGVSQAEIAWNPLEYPMVIVRDADTGQVLSLGRSGRVRVSPTSDRVQLEFSNGLGTVATSVRLWR